MKNKISYKIAKKEHVIRLISLYKKFYPTERWNIKTIEWEYFNNPFGKAKVFLALSGDKLVGFTSSVPIITKMKSDLFRGYRTQNVLTDIDYRGQGIFSRLILNNNDYLDRFSDINISFPNKNSLPFFIKTNWSKVCEIPLFEKKIKKIEKTNLRYSLISEFKNIHKDLWEKNLLNKIDILCNKKYLNWRFIANPKSEYMAFEIINNFKPIGFIVLKIYSANGKIKIGHIVKLSCPKNYTSDAFNFANNFFYNLKIKKFNTWIIGGKNIFYNGLNFNKKSLQNRFFIYRSNNNINSIKWNLSMSFSDVY